jgi:predicted nuclease of predicted toxin-antitoxin system
MKFLADQDVYAITIDFLSRLGHDVVPPAQLGLRSAEDAVLLRVGHEHGRILVTRDRDCGAELDADDPRFYGEWTRHAENLSQEQPANT